MIQNQISVARKGTTTSTRDHRQNVWNRKIHIPINWLLPSEPKKGIVTVGIRGMTWSQWYESQLPPTGLHAELSSNQMPLLVDLAIIRPMAS